METKYQSELLREERLLKGLTQEQVAERAGISIQHYKKFENGSSSLMTYSYSVSCRVLEALNLNVEDFYEHNKTIG